MFFVWLALSPVLGVRYLLALVEWCILVVLCFPVLVREGVSGAILLLLYEFFRRYLSFMIFTFL